MDTLTNVKKIDWNHSTELRQSNLLRKNFTLTQNTQTRRVTKRHEVVQIDSFIEQNTSKTNLSKERRLTDDSARVFVRYLRLDKIIGW